MFLSTVPSFFISGSFNSSPVFSLSLPPAWSMLAFTWSRFMGSPGFSGHMPTGTPAKEVPGGRLCTFAPRQVPLFEDTLDHIRAPVRRFVAQRLQRHVGRRRVERDSFIDACELNDSDRLRRLTCEGCSLGSANQRRASARNGAGPVHVCLPSDRIRDFELRHEKGRRLGLSASHSYPKGADQHAAQGGESELDCRIHL